MIELIRLIRTVWYTHAKGAFYVAATTFWGYMTIMFYIPMLMKVR